MNQLGLMAPRLPHLPLDLKHAPAEMSSFSVCPQFILYVRLFGSAIFLWLYGLLTLFTGSSFDLESVSTCPIKSASSGWTVALSSWFSSAPFALQRLYLSIAYTWEGPGRRRNHSDSKYKGRFTGVGL
jgi:hypothetical protein